MGLQKKRIGVLTSGGDCAGLNAALRAITCRAVQTYGWEVIGIHNGPSGLLTRPLDYEELTVEKCEGVLRHGGTLLGSTNKDFSLISRELVPFENPSAPKNSGEILSERLKIFYEGYHELGLTALIGIGGDGSLSLLRRAAQEGGLQFVAIPKTIDNDIGLTESAIGFQTAVEVATEALDRLQPTAASHHRVMVLEVMGRDAGHIALSAGIAGGADVILIPEIPYKLEVVCQKITALAARGRPFALVVVAEAVRKESGEAMGVPDNVPEKGQQKSRLRYGGIGHYLGEKIQEMTGAETRVTVLGHVQRGGQPGAADRLIATAFGVAAVDLIAQGKFDRMVAWQHRQVVDVPLGEALGGYQGVDPQSALLRTARGLGICLGIGE